LEAERLRQVEQRRQEQVLREQQEQVDWRLRLRLQLKLLVLRRRCQGHLLHRRSLQRLDR
jgi:hypothetical protein